MSTTNILHGLLVSVLFFSTPVFGKEKVVIADFSSEVGRTGVPAGWQLKEKDGKADFAFLKENGVAAVRLRSRNTSYSLQKEVDVDLKRIPMLTWKWKVVTLPENGDFRRSKTDDQAAQLFVAFSKTRAIVYIWDTSAPQGMMGDTPGPFFMSIKAVVLRSGKTDAGKWINEARNVYEDYKKLFNEEPGKVSGMRIQINSQHTRTSAESYFAEVAFESQ